MQQIIAPGAKTENPLLPEVTKLTLMLFFKELTCPIFLFFCISVTVDELNKWVERKGHLVNKNLSLVTPGTGISSLPDP